MLIVSLLFSSVEKPDSVNVMPPSKAKNKGSGAGGRRIRSGKEVGIASQTKSKRKCSKCGEYAGHNS